jgi:dipeptidase
MMTQYFGSWMLALYALLAEGFDVDGCTSIVVGRNATIDGSAMASHANDCADCDWRVAYVPAKDHAIGTMRTIYDAVWSQYPRLVDTSRSRQYTAGAGVDSSQILGKIPQASHTYALWEASYGLMNEHGLGMGESTCPGYLIANAVNDGGNALFSVGNLMAVALERCKTSRCAIQTMGDLGAKYGFYGEDPGKTGAGEAVTIVDKAGDAWVFHITAGVVAASNVTSWAGQRGALWVAQRVPAGHVAVVANSFTIQEVNATDSENFMFHPGLFDLTKEAGMYAGVGPFNWQKIMAPDLASFSYFPGQAPIPMYSTLRMWGVYRQAAPSAGLTPSQHMEDLPFSVPVDKKVSHLDVMNWFRGHYEGTEFDMRLGALAGPWQSPNRVEGGFGQRTVPGQFARSTSIPRTSYTVILQSGIQ